MTATITNIYKATITSVSDIQPDASVIVGYTIYKNNEAFCNETIQCLPDMIERMVKDKLELLRAVEEQEPNKLVGKEII